MTNVKKENITTTIIDTIQNLRCRPVCGREERAEYRRKKALRKKAISVAILVITFTLLTGGVLFAFAKENNSPDSSAYTVVVEDGDSLWSIAKTYFPNSDPRSAIEDIRKLNDLDNYTIYAGMTLLIPGV